MSKTPNRRIWDAYAGSGLKRQAFAEALCVNLANLGIDRTPSTVIAWLKEPGGKSARIAPLVAAIQAEQLTDEG